MCMWIIFELNINVLSAMYMLPMQESVSEDPHLNGMYSASLLQGFQGDDPKHLGVAATCKHFLAYSLEGGPAAEGFTVKWLNVTLSCIRFSRQ